MSQFSTYTMALMNDKNTVREERDGGLRPGHTQPSTLWHGGTEMSAIYNVHTWEPHNRAICKKKKNYNHVWRKLTVVCWAAGVPPLWDTWSSARVTPACWEQRESTFYVILKANTSVREWITPREGIKICWKELERIFYVHGNVPYPDTDLVLQFRPKPKSLVQTRFLNI